MYFTSRHVYLRSPEKRVKRRRAQIQAARQSAEEIESGKRVCAWCSMPFSNTPFDLKTVIVRALDSACTNAATRIKRLFKSILWRYQGASATFVPDGTRSVEQPHNKRTCREHSPYRVD
jgi:hypothetical protein